MTESSITIHTEDNAELADVREQAGTMEFRWRSANAYAASKMVPEHFRNNPQDCYVVWPGSLSSWESPACSATEHFYDRRQAGLFSPVRHSVAESLEGFRRADPTQGRRARDDQLSVTAYAPLHDGDVVEMTVDLALAKRENWTKNSKYKTMPEQMLKHRANKWLISMYAPEVLLGLDFELLRRHQRQKAPEH